MLSIGEMPDGKSSPLDALTLLLRRLSSISIILFGKILVSAWDVRSCERHLHIILTFRENEPGRHRVRRYRSLSKCWFCDDVLSARFYRPEGEFR